MIKFIGSLLVVAVITLFLIGLSDLKEKIRPQGQIVSVHVGPRLFYNIDYYCCEDGFERVDVVDRVLSRKSYLIKEIDGVKLVRSADEPLGEGQAVPRWDSYETIPEELRRHIDYARQRALEYRAGRLARKVP